MGGAIIACPIDRNTSLIMPMAFKGMTFSVGGGDSLEFVPLYCPTCKCICMWFDKESIVLDEDVWRYK
jgi:hypothetical protein